MEAKNKQKFNIPFLCNGNSARSTFAEYLMNQMAPGQFQAFSAGADPRGEVHPMTLKVLKEVHHLDASDATSKSWETFEGGPEFDFVITVCDKARENCPVWPGQPIIAHWGFADPVSAEGSEEEILRVFRNVSIELRRRIELFISLPFDKLDKYRIEEMTKQIGTGERSELETGEWF